MKAYRNIAGVVHEIQVDIGLDGQPILPPDTTVDPRPEPQPGHYVTVVGNAWVQIEIPVAYESLDTKKDAVLKRIAAYRDWLLSQPVDVDGVLFDGDEAARERLTQALVIFREIAYLPPSWVTHDNSEAPLADADALRNIAGKVTAAFSQRFYECNTLRAQAMAAQDEAALNAVVIPATPGVI